MIRATLSLLLLASAAHAVPVELTDPCVEKTLVVRKARNASPAKPSPILAWVTVRSGGPLRPDAPRCTDETILLDSPEPEFIGYEPSADYSLIDWPEIVESGDAYWMPVRHWTPSPAGRPVARSAAPIITPPASVPEPSTVALMLIGACGLLFRRRVTQ